MRNLSSALLDRSISFATYQDWFDSILMRAPKRYSAKEISYIPLNAHRMRRWLKKDRLLTKVKDRLGQFDHPMHLLVITEAWCGDAAQVIPVLVQMAKQNPLLKISIVMRDEEPELMDSFLTEGKRAIPKILILDPVNSYQVFGTWGPRPKAAQHLMNQGLAQWQNLPEGKPKEQFRADLYTSLHKWYTQDKTVATQLEILQVLASSLEAIKTLIASEQA